MNIEVGNTLSLIFSICDQPLTEVCGKISGQQWLDIAAPSSDLQRGPGAGTPIVPTDLIEGLPQPLREANTDSVESAHPNQQLPAAPDAERSVSVPTAKEYALDRNVESTPNDAAEPPQAPGDAPQHIAPAEAGNAPAAQAESTATTDRQSVAERVLSESGARDETPVHVDHTRADHVGAVTSESDAQVVSGGFRRIEN